MIMPYYAVAVGLSREEVGMAYNKEIVTDLLRDKLGFHGRGELRHRHHHRHALGRRDAQRRRSATRRRSTPAWTGSAATRRRRSSSSWSRSGALTEARIDESARRILRVLFALGLFENPYVNPEEAARTVRKAEFQQKADLAQRKSIVLLKNAGNLLPLKPGVRMYVDGVDPAVAARYGYVSTSDPDERGRLRRARRGRRRQLRPAAAAARCRST